MAQSFKLDTSFESQQSKIREPIEKTDMTKYNSILETIDGIMDENDYIMKKYDTSHDELEKKTGTVSSRIGGSARGHNGLKSIINFGAGECWRIRCGIDRPANKDDVPEYVLSNFLPLENVNELINSAIKEIKKIIESN